MMAAPRRRVGPAVVAAVVGAAGLAALLAAGPRASTLAALNRAASSTPLDVVATSGAYPPAGVGYPWLAGRVLVEPHRETTLHAVGAGAEAVAWTVERQDRGVGPSTTHRFSRVGEHAVALATATRSASVDVYCRYVRRELRSLTDADRVAYFDAVAAVYATPTEAGRRAYGPNFRNVAWFVAQHNVLSGARDCDHFHDGLGFLPQHAAFTSKFDRALQAVNPAVSVPYWDYTIEAGYVAAAGGDMRAWRASPVFGDDWFGSAEPAGRAVRAGRWAYTSVAAGAWNVTTCNAYGLVRAPWNNNPVPFLTRANTTFGFSLSDVPACSDHYAVMQDTTYAILSFRVAVGNRCGGPLNIR